MIAKRISREKGTSSPARLVRYMVAAQGGLNPISWARTVDYLLVTKETTEKGERVGSYRVTNCETDDPADATEMIVATQLKNKKSKADKTYHLVFSFKPGEEPLLDVLHAIEDELCSSIGYADHQRVSAVHTDKDHLHVHVAINKVHPTGLQNIEPYYDKFQLMEACERLEIKYHLQRTNHGLSKDKSHERDDRTGKVRLEPTQQPGQRDSRFRQFLRKSHDLTLTEPPEAATLNGLRNLSSCYMARTAQGATVLLQDNARFGVESSGKEPVDSLRREGNGDRTVAGETRGRRLSSKAAEIEIQSGIETLAGYVARDVSPEIRKATNWIEVHQVLAEHGLQAKLHGAGLVIGDDSIPLWTRASQCGRDLSLKSMTDRLGAFEALQKQSNKAFVAKPRQTHPTTSALFAQYQRERQANIVARRQGMAQIKSDGIVFIAKLQKWRTAQRMLLKAGAKGAARKIMQTTIKVQSDASMVGHRNTMATRRQNLFAQTSMPVWADWLTQQAGNGNIDALAILRSRTDKENRLRGDLLTVEHADRAKHNILRALKPQARKDGAMAYRTADGGMVIDRTTYVQAQAATAGAALVAIELASQRFNGQALIVEGTVAFQRDVAQLAGLHKLNIRFADPVMEQARQVATELKTNRLAPKENLEKLHETKVNADQFASDKSLKSTSSAVELWIAKRNETSEKVSSINSHRLWKSTDTGVAIYQGRRKIEDGSEVLLLKLGSEILVKPSSPKVVAMASKWKIGRTVTLDAIGRFVHKKDGVEL